MTSPTQPGTALTPEEREKRLENRLDAELEQSADAKPGRLPAEAEQEYLERRQANAIAVKLAGTSFGKNMSVAARAALAEWGRRNQIDVLEEIDILFGRIYRRATFFINRAQPYLHAGILEYLVTEHIHNDARLEALVVAPLPPTAIDAENLGDEEREFRRQERERIYQEKGKASAELRRRRELRVQFGIPDDATGATIARTKPRGLDIELVAAKWTGPKRPKDEIGNAFPQETCETRSLRRVLRLCVGYLPGMQRILDSADDDALANVQDIIGQSHASNRQALEERKAKALGPGTAVPIAAGYGEDISMPSRQPRGAEAPVVVAGERKPDAAQLARHLEGPEPYGESAGTVSGTAASGAVQDGPPPAAVDAAPPAPALPSDGDSPPPGARMDSFDCGECGREIWDTSDHRPDCSKYAD